MTQGHRDKLEAVCAEFSELLSEAVTEESVRALAAKYLSKKGPLSEVMKSMKDLSGDERKSVGQAFNKAKGQIDTEVAAKLQSFAEEKRKAYLNRWIDVTVPGRQQATGALHLLTQVQKECVDIFRGLGFGMATGPQIETDFHSFEALAIPKNHPARDMQDTFYLGDEMVLRPHTSPVQIRTMQSQEPPIAIIAPGVVYRRDDDPTHSPMFMQIEGLWVDKVVRFSDLKGVLWHFVNTFFGKSLEIRFRPSYFPFVEPGAEVDMQCSFCDGAGCGVCKGTGWVEIGGAGMVDPAVFANVNVDSEAWTGFAFGMGIERMAMLKYGVNDIKYYYEGDLRFLRQFS